MKTLFIGGIKSGKSLHAEQYALHLSKKNKAPKNIYLATCEVYDAQMLERIETHKEQRKNNFTTLEEPIHIAKAIQQFKPNQIILIECITMWLNNMLYHKYSHPEIFNQLEEVLTLPHSLIFVLNDVGSGIIPDNVLAREFIDLSGKVSQLLSKNCEQVFFCIAGLKQQLK